MNKKTRIIIVVNKYWECDPVCWVLTNEYINDNGQCTIDLDVVKTMSLLTYPTYGPVKPKKAEDSTPRIVFETDSRIIEIWCISDLLSNSSSSDQSSSEEKMKLMPIIFDFNYKNIECEIELVIAVGTASSGPSLAINSDIKGDNINGSVVIGSKVFMHNGGWDYKTNDWDQNTTSHYECDCWSEILSSGSTSFIKNLQSDDMSVYEPLLLCPTTNPSPLGQHFYVRENYIALGDVNVTDYKKYSEKDTETGNDFFAHYLGNVDGLSLETTHCLIYLSAKKYFQNENPPFIFVSGVVDRYTKFSTDVNPKIYAQNVTGAQNAGVAVAYIISKFIK